MDDRPSKSALKQEARRLQSLGAALTRLNEEQLARLPLSSELRDALRAYRRIHSHEAGRRQAQFIGRLMRDEDTPAIARGLDDLQQISGLARNAHQEVERWRTRLLETDLALTEYITRYPDTDRVALRNLIRLARRNPENPSRPLFRFIRTDQQRRSSPAADT